MLLGCLGLVGCGGASTKRTTTGGGTGMSLTGPVAVVPGRTVRFTGTGFRPGGDVNVVLTPADRSTCCSITIPSSFRVTDSGAAVLEFDMPTYYRRCTALRMCKRIAWRPGEKVIVAASGYLQEARATTTVASPSE